MELEDDTQQDIKHMFQAQDLTQSVCNLNLDNEDENTDSDEEPCNPNIDKNHPFYLQCKAFHERLREYDIDEVRKYLLSDEMKFSLMQLHDQYRREIADLPNDNLIKQEIDTILWYLEIPPNKFLIDPITSELIQ